MEAQTDAKKIGPNDLQKWIEQGRAITIINTLPGEEYAKRHHGGYLGHKSRTAAGNNQSVDLGD